MDVLGDRLLGGLEAGRHDEYVDRALHAVRGDDRVAGDLGDPVRDELDVVGRERGVVGVGDQDPLAADLVARRHLRAQAGSLIPFAMLASASFLAGAASAGFHTKPGT